MTKTRVDNRRSICSPKRLIVKEFQRPQTMTTTQAPPPPQQQQQQQPGSMKQPKSRGQGSGRSGVFAMTELKQRILTSLSKLGDRDTQQVAMEDMEKTVQTLSPEGIIVCLNCLYDTDFQQKGIVRKECVKLLGTMATTHSDLLVPHLPKIISHIVKRLKDPDSAVRDACHATMGVLAAQYLNGNSNLVSVFVKPLFEALGEQNKSAQSGAAMCLAKLIENAKDPPLSAFQRLCPRISKYFTNPNFLAKAHLLSVIASLSQVGALSQQHLSILMPCINESLESTDWATRKAAVDTLCRMATHSSDALMSFKSSTISMLEACRFDKVKPVRDSVIEGLQLWKNIPWPEDDSNSAEPKPPSQDTEISDVTGILKKVNLEHSNSSANEVNCTLKALLDNTNEGSNDLLNAQSLNLPEKTVGFLKKKAPVLTDKELNPEFFQKLEKKGLDDWQVEVAVPRGHPPSAQSEREGQTEDNIRNMQASSATQGERLDVAGMQSTGDTYNGLDNTDDFSQDQWMSRRAIRIRDSKARIMESDDWGDLQQRDLGGTRSESYGDAQITTGKGNWLVIQRQLLQMEQQQAMLMEMLEDFMGNSQDSMLSLENRVRGLERVVEDMARDLAFSAGRRAGSHMIGYDGPPSRSLNRFPGAPEYPGPKFAKGNDSRGSFSEWFPQSDSIPLGARARETQWRSSDAGSDTWDGYPHVTCRNGHLVESQVNMRRGTVGVSNDGRLSRQEHQNGEQVNRRAWDRGSGPVREGPSARSVWQASKDEATLAAIRVAGEDAETSRRCSRVPVAELDGEVLQYNNGQGKGPLWNAWSRAMQSLHAGDIDSAYGEVLFTGDEFLLVRLMSRSGPVLEQLSSGTASEVLHAIGQLLQQQSFFDFGIQWIQQVADMVVESGPECLGLSLDMKKEFLLSLQESSGMELPEDWEGNTVDELLVQLANAWSIDLPQNGAGS